MPKSIKWSEITPNLKFLQLPGAGLDGLNKEDLPENCVVCNVYEHEASIVEYVFGCLFNYSSKWLDNSIKNFKEGVWTYFDRIGQGSRSSICGKTIGIIGFGHIG